MMKALVLFTAVLVVVVVGCAKATPTPTPTPSPTPTPYPTIVPTPTVPQLATPDTEVVRELALKIGDAFVKGDHVAAYALMSPQFKAECDPKMYSLVASMNETSRPIWTKVNRDVAECRVSQLRIEDRRAWVDIDVYESDEKVLDLVTMDETPVFRLGNARSYFFEKSGNDWYVYSGEPGDEPCQPVRWVVEQWRILEQSRVEATTAR